MKVMMVRPGPHWSVADVADGWARAFRALGADLFEVDLDNILWFYANAKVPQNDEEVLAFDWDGAVREAGDRIKARTLEFWPDVVVVVSGFFVREPLIDLLRARGIATVLICTESPYQDVQQAGWAEHFDVTLINDPTNAAMFQQVCKNVYYVGHSYDPVKHRPGPGVDGLRSDVCMVGTGYPSRIAWLDQVDWSGIDLRLGGNWRGLEDHPLRHRVAQAKLSGCLDNTETADWYRSTLVGLNLYRKEADAPSLSDGWAMGPREVELAACETFYMTEARGENRALLPFVPVVESPAQFSEDVRWWLDRPKERTKIARKAREALAGWTFENRARLLLQLLDRQPVTIHTGGFHNGPSSRT